LQEHTIIDTLLADETEHGRNKKHGGNKEDDRKGIAPRRYRPNELRFGRVGMALPPFPWPSFPPRFSLRTAQHAGLLVKL